MRSGIKRLKQHLAGGYGDVAKCPHTTTELMREMREYLMKKSRSKPINIEDDGDDGDEDDVEVPLTQVDTSTPQPSSGTATKRKNAASQFFNVPPKMPKQSKSIASIIRKTPEEVVDERHMKGPTQTTLEQCTKSKEEKERVFGHISDFFYENGIPFNAANSRSYEIMVESIGQFGPGLKPPSYHELRVPLLEKAKKKTEKLREKHELAWKEYGCTLMSDGWSDRRNRHLINFLVNSPEGTFFLDSVDASAESQDATLLAGLLEKKIEEVGKDKVVQVVTDNGSNYKAAGKLLEHKIPTLYWTPCAAHCLDLMLEDIGKLADFKPHINKARRVTTFIYRHTRILHSMRQKTGGKDLVRPGVTRFATAFLTLQSLYKHREALRNQFSGLDWVRSKLAATEAGMKVREIVFSTRFWSAVEDCIRASQPLLVVLRIVDADEQPAMPELSLAMDCAKEKINEAFENKARVLRSLIGIIETRWEVQMEVKLYGAALFLNPSKYFDLKQTNPTSASRQRSMFNDVLEKMVTDETLQAKISDQATDYDKLRGSFAKQLAIKQQKSKSPLDWWDAFGGLAVELQSFTKRIVGLCCTSSGCERNWSTFEFIHTKKRNRLEHKRLNDLVFIQYNRKIATRFQKRREEGKNFNPLIFEDFQWNNEWVSNEVVHPGDDLLWSQVDEALGASSSLQGRNLPRTSSSRGESVYYRRRGSNSSNSSLRLIDEDMNDEEESFPNDDEDVEDDYGQTPPTSTHDDEDQGNEGRRDDLVLDDF
ncbi:unnamed protein product [Cuscuta epithymum]|uniref:DUF659 domain-containing protein n=1 Tax=Cuscuta epithymum TaxID=186058 RepID=A0AAV0FMK0_9ASTE|nr:unnamed protein product [Cuscuta epithymum]